MCGIFGFNWEDKKLLQDMGSIIAHRGPDQKGFYTDKNVSLGHVRLSIIDLSIKGKQPMTNEEKDIFISYNGEIYNFNDIRGYLESKGHVFSSNTDTEVIVHAYEEYGEKCVSLFNGMFAFAIWDSRKKIFFLARDRVGVKPLYYYHKDSKFIFGSEIKAILSSGIKRTIDMESFYNFLTFRYVPGEGTIFKDIKKLLPGHYLVFDFKGGSVNIGKYWDLGFSTERKSAKAYSKDIDVALKEAVNKRLISDVPLGAFLSGGLDSTYIVALMKELCDKPIRTFSVGFESGEGYDESKFSRFVAERYGTDHHEMFVKEGSFNLLPKILWHMDEPIADFASIPTYILSEFAKKKVSVVLTGEGADELFGGYRKYRYLKAFNYYYNLTHSKLRKALSISMGVFGNSLPFERLKEFHSSPSVSDYYLQLISFFTKREKEGLCDSLDVGREDIKIVKPFFGNREIVDSLMALDFKTWLPDDLLMKVDKTTMAHALEARVPYLDPNLIELSSRIPHNLKIRFNKEKYVLREAMKNKVPAKIYNRKKHGFNVPVHRWLGEELKDISMELLSKDSVRRRGLFNHNYIQKIFNNYNKSKMYYSRQLWTLLNFEIWARIYLDNEDLNNKNIGFDDILG